MGVRPKSSADPGRSFHDEDWEAWRIRSLRPGESETIYFRDPREATDPDRKGGPALGLIWYHPNYMRWSGCIQIYEKKEQWHGGLELIGPFRGKHAHWPLQKDAPLPDPE